MRQEIGCRPVPQLQTLWVNMIYIFVIYTNICVYNVFVYGGQWPHVLCIFTLYISIRSSIMFCIWWAVAQIFCAFLLCTFLFVHYGRQVHPVPVCSVHVYSVYFYYLCFCHVCFYSGQKLLSAPFYSFIMGVKCILCLSVLCMSIMCISIICVSIMYVSILGKTSPGQHTRCCVEAGETLRKEHFRH